MHAHARTKKEGTSRNRKFKREFSKEKTQKRELKHFASNIEPLRAVIIPNGSLDCVFAYWRKQNKG